LDPRYNTDIPYGRSHPRPSSRSAPTHRKIQNRPDKLRGVENILPDGTIVVPLVDEDEYVEEYDDEFEIEPSWYGQDMDDFRGRYPRASLSNGPRLQVPSHAEKNTSHREISTKALTKSSRLQRDEAAWNDDHYLETFENQGFEDDIAQPPITYNKREQRNKSNRYANVNFHHNEFGQSSRNVSENEFDDRSSGRHNWATSSIPGSLSDKYRGVDLYEEEFENTNPDVVKTKTVFKSKSKSPLLIRDDGVITTISQTEEQIHDDRCSSVISLSDKYRNQEEVEIFQENFHYKPPPDPIRPNEKTNQTSSEMSTYSSNSANTKNTEVPNSDKQSLEEKEPGNRDDKEFESNDDTNEKKLN